MICLGDPDKGFPIDQTTYSKLLKLLSMISSHKVSVEQKLAMLEQEYHIATTRKLEEGFNTMCNWSEAIIERIRRDVVNEFTDEVKNNIIDKVTKEIRDKVTDEIRNEVTNEIRNEVTNEIRNEVTNEIRNEVTNEIRNEVTEEIILNIMHSLEYSFEKACEILKLNPTDYASLKKRLIDTTI